MKCFSVVLFAFLSIGTAQAQNIGIGTSNPNSNAKLEIADTSKGILIPRMDSVHRKAIPNTEGLLVYDVNYKSFWYNDGSNWMQLTSLAGSNGGGVVTPPIDADGNVYPITKIGNQWWMALSLKTTHYANGDSIPNVTTPSSWTSQSSGAWCNYNNDSTTNSWGKLYNYYTVTDARNACPVGWHIPNDAEWTTMRTYISTAGNKLKTAGNSFWLTQPATTPSYGNNSTGFSALPSGQRTKPLPPVGTIDAFNDRNYGAYFWSSTPAVFSNGYFFANRWYISSESNNLYLGYKTPEAGFSIRCIQN